MPPWSTWPSRWLADACRATTAAASRRRCGAPCPGWPTSRRRACTGQAGARPASQALLSAAPRLLLRVPRERAAELRGARRAHARRRPAGPARWARRICASCCRTRRLYAHFVARGGRDEAAFMDAVARRAGSARRALPTASAASASGAARSGAAARLQPDAARPGAADALRLLEQGPGRRTGCWAAAFSCRTSRPPPWAAMRFTALQQQGDRTMGYTVNGAELETDDEGYLLEPDYSDEAVRVIAAAEGIALTDAHWEVINYLRDEYREHGHTPNFRNMLKGLAGFCPAATARRCTTCSRPARPSRAPRSPACRSRWARAGTEAHIIGHQPAHQEPLVQGRRAEDARSRPPARWPSSPGAWRINMLKRMREADFDIDAGPPYFGFMREVLVFLLQLARPHGLCAAGAPRRARRSPPRWCCAWREILQDNEARPARRPPPDRRARTASVHRPVQ